jgi:hypothetical protein
MKMTPIKYVAGDIFPAIERILETRAKKKSICLPHVCNDVGAWGSGFVVPLGKKYPEAREKYLAEKPTLGTTQIIPVEKNVIVYNMVAQKFGGVRPLFYNELAKCMDAVAKDILDKFPESNDGAEIHAPLFGADLAGGNFQFIKELILDCWVKKGIPVTIYYLPEKAHLLGESLETN